LVIGWLLRPEFLLWGKEAVGISNHITAQSQQACRTYIAKLVGGNANQNLELEGDEKECSFELFVNEVLTY
jgi:hypothetical protein